NEFRVPGAWRQRPGYGKRLGMDYNSSRTCVDQHWTPRLAGSWCSVLRVLCVSGDSGVCTAAPAMRFSLVERKPNHGHNTSVCDICRLPGDSNDATRIGALH